MVKFQSFTQAKTGASAPTLATEGQLIAGCKGVCATVSAPAGETFSSGSFACYLYLVVTADADGNPTACRWARYAALDITPTSGQRDCASGSFEDVVGAASRILWLPVTVATSGAGANVTSVQAVKV